MWIELAQDKVQWRAPVVPSGSIKGEFFDQMSYCQLLEKDCSLELAFKDVNFPQGLRGRQTEAWNCGRLPFLVFSGGCIIGTK
jgi:hypothetical protein